MEGDGVGVSVDPNVGDTDTVALTEIEPVVEMVADGVGVDVGNGNVMSVEGGGYGKSFDNNTHKSL